MPTVTLQGTAQVNDTYMDQNSATTNFGTSVVLAIGEDNTGVALYRTLIKFDLTSIPVGATITSANLTLYANTDLSSNARTLSAYRALRAWVDTQATWNVYTTGNNWTTAGANDTTNDREAGAIGTVTQPASPSPGDPVTMSLTPSLVQAMIPGGGFTNNGFVMRVATESDDAIVYESTQSASASLRPKLVIDYSSGGFMTLNTKKW